MNVMKDNDPITSNLNDAIEMRRLKAEEYGEDTHLRGGRVLAELFPDGVTLESPSDFAMFQHVGMIVSKLNRYCANFDNNGHIDSAADITVYGAMLKEATEYEI